MIKDEYLDITQVAYLLNYTDDRRVSTLVNEGKLKAYKRNNNGRRHGKKDILIKASDLLDYSKKKLNRYRNYYAWKEAEDKVAYWDESDYTGLRLVDESEYISCTQMAYLLGIQRQAVSKAIDTGAISIEILKIRGKQRKLIKTSVFMEYAEQKLKYYGRLIAYLNAEDKLEYWEGIKDE